MILLVLVFMQPKPFLPVKGGWRPLIILRMQKHMSINRLHGISKDVWDRYSGGGWEYDIIDNGNKYNSTDLNAALGLSQLNKLEWMRDKRALISQQYDEAFKGKNHITSYKRGQRNKLSFIL